MSVIMATYNSAEYLGETLLAIRAQEYSQFELVITDDASSDETIVILERAAQEDKRLRVMRNSRNVGPAHARNRSIEAARGRFVAFCDADDLWRADKLLRQLAFMRDRSAAISFTAYEIMDRHGRPTGRFVDRGSRAVADYEDLLRKKATMGCSTVMVDRGLTGEFSMPDIRTGQDYATWLHILRSGHVAHCLDTPLTRYRITPGSISRNKFKKAIRQWQIYQHIEKLSVPKSLWCFANYAYSAVIRK